tara:strand:- start:21604 stop:23544 length:1941 start_codon:yes stop_codon:yes gene_type:complete
MQDITKVKSNIRIILDAGGTEKEVDTYLGEIGVSLEQLQEHNPNNTIEGAPEMPGEFGQQAPRQPKGNPITRMGEAIAEPFTEPEYGFSPETFKKFETGVKPVDFVSKALVMNPLSAGLSALQAGGAGMDALFANAPAQAARELGAGESANRFEKDMKGFMRSPVAMMGVNGIPATAQMPFRGRAMANQIGDIALPGKNVTREAIKKYNQSISQREIKNAEQMQVPLTKGDRSQVLSEQNFEEDALKGLEGEGAQRIAATQRQGQSAALKNQQDRIQMEMNEGQPPLTVAEQGTGLLKVSDELKAKNAAAKADISARYKAAKETEASVGRTDVEDFLIKTIEDLDDYDLDTFPSFQRSVDEIAEMGATPRASIGHLEKWRKRLVTRAEGTTNRAEQAAIKRLKKGYDSFVDDMLQKDLIEGSPEAVAAWKDARGSVIRYHKQFTQNKIVKKIIDDDLNQEELISIVFNTNGQGFKVVSGRIVKDLKKALGENSESFKSLKEEAFVRLLRNQGDEFSGAKFKTALDSALEKTPTAMREIFSQKEIAMMRDFQGVASRATTKLNGVVNYSNSANKFFQRWSANLPLIEPALKMLNNSRSAIKAEKAFNPGGVPQPIRATTKKYNTPLSQMVRTEMIAEQQGLFGRGNK